MGRSASGCVGIVLAAGAASRMGHRPKCLLRIDGRPLIERQINALHEVGIEDITVVLGHYRNEVRAALSDLSGGLTVINFVEQTVDEHSQRTSLALGLRAAGAGHAGYLVTPSDMPGLTAKDYRLLLEAYFARSDQYTFVAPWVDSRPGNPVVFYC